MKMRNRVSYCRHDLFDTSSSGVIDFQDLEEFVSKGSGV